MVPQPLPGLKMCDHYTNITKRSVSSVIADSELEFFTWNLSRNGRWTLLLQLSGMTNFWVFLHSDEEFSCFVLWCQLLCPKLNGTRWRLLRSSYLFVLPICKHSGNHMEARRQLEIPRIMKLIEFGTTTTEKQTTNSVHPIIGFLCVKKNISLWRKKFETKSCSFCGLQLKVALYKDWLTKYTEKNPNVCCKTFHCVFIAKYDAVDTLLSGNNTNSSTEWTASCLRKIYLEVHGRTQDTTDHLAWSFHKGKKNLQVSSVVSSIFSQFLYSTWPRTENTVYACVCMNIFEKPFPDTQRRIGLNIRRRFFSSMCWGTGTGSPGQWLQPHACWSWRSIWAKLSAIWPDFWVVLCGASWTQWFSWVSSNSGCSVTLWF